MAATMEDLFERFPNCQIPKCNYLTARPGANANGRCGRFDDNPKYGNISGMNYIHWSLRSAKTHQENDDDVRNRQQNGKVRWSVSTDAEHDERDSATIRHELAHVYYNKIGDADFKMACNLAVRETGDQFWYKKVSEYACEKLTERHSECFSLATRSDYKKGTLPPSIEKYIFEKMLGCQPGQW